MNSIELVNLFFPGALGLLGLVLDQRVELFLFGIPADGVLSQLPTKLLLRGFDQLNFKVGLGYLVLLCLQVALVLLDD